MLNDNIKEHFTNKNVLVTGGTGLIGRQVVDILDNYGVNINIVSLDKIKFESINDKITYIYGDLTDFNFCKEITKNMDYVFHIAGIKGSIDVTKTKPASFFVPMLMMNTNILEACRINKVKKFVYTSSIGAYSSAEVFKESNYCIDKEPMDMYPGWAKRMAEMQIQAYKTQYNLNNFAIVRPCNVYGPGDNFDPNNAMVIPSLMYKILQQQPKYYDIPSLDVEPIKIWGDGSAIRDFAYSKDVAEGIILALHYGTSKSSTGFINLGSGIGYTIKELVETLHKFLNFSYMFDISKSSGFPKRVMDINLAKELINYNPTTSLEQGLKETWNWFVHNQDEYLKKKNYFSEE